MEPNLKEFEAPDIEDGAHRLHERYGIGYRLLHKMGFKIGQGLGAQQQGIAQPLVVTPLPERHGLNEAIAQSSITQAKPEETLAPPPSRKLKAEAAISAPSTSGAASFEYNDSKSSRVTEFEDKVWFQPSGSAFAPEASEVCQMLQSTVSRMREWIKQEDERALTQATLDSYLVLIESPEQIASLNSSDRGNIIIDAYITNFESEYEENAEQDDAAQIDDTFVSACFSRIQRKVDIQQHALDNFSELKDAATRVCTLADIIQRQRSPPPLIASSLFQIVKQVFLEVLHQLPNDLLRFCGFGDVFCGLTAICAAWEIASWTILIFDGTEIMNWRDRFTRTVRGHTNRFEEWMIFAGPLVSFHSYDFLGRISNCVSQRMRRYFFAWKPGTIGTDARELVNSDIALQIVLDLWNDITPLEYVAPNIVIPKLRRKCEEYLEESDYKQDAVYPVLQWIHLWRRWLGIDAFDLSAPMLKKALQRIEAGALETVFWLSGLQAEFPDEMELFLQRGVIPSVSQQFKTQLGDEEVFSTLVKGAATFLSPHGLYLALQSGSVFKYWRKELRNNIRNPSIDLNEVEAKYRRWKSLFESLHLDTVQEFRFILLNVLQTMDAVLS